MRDDVGECIKTLTEAYNAALCLEVCAGMCARLPRELRDSIYGYLMRGRVSVNNLYTGDIVIGARKMFSFLELRRAGREIHEEPYFADSPRTAEDQLCGESFWVEDATGRDVAAELMQNWVRSPMYELHVRHTLTSYLHLLVSHHGVCHSVGQRSTVPVVRGGRSLLCRTRPQDAHHESHQGDCRSRGAW